MSGSPVISVTKPGAERQPIVVIDALAPDPEALRQMAARSRFVPAGSLYPGVRAPVPASYFAGFGPLLGQIIREQFDYHGAARFTAVYFALVTVAPDDLALPQRIPHIDGLTPHQLAMVHYLSPQDFGGTAFFRHRATGFETVDAARHPAYMSALRTEFARDGEPSARYIDGDTAQFQEIARIEPSFNRAILYRSSQLHCAVLPNDRALPADVLGGRLTVTAFIDVS